PQTTSFPSRPRILSLPPRPTITSGPAVPISVSRPFVPTIVASWPMQLGADMAVVAPIEAAATSDPTSNPKKPFERMKDPSRLAIDGSRARPAKVAQAPHNGRAELREGRGRPHRMRHSGRA